MFIHKHKYKFESEYSNGHPHKLVGYASHMLGVNNLHFHFFYGVSSYNDHTHYFSGITGIPIKTENGHIHKMEGILESSLDHEHKFRGYTFEEVSYISGKGYREVYI
ncbi:MAG TPA: hypothetical protein GXX20_04065 [Clostridiaceae bacterium]|nr:hypothetical protein [Clostridiaceae bacterium]